MDALELLLNRRSVAKLVEPAPEGEHLENIIKAGLRAPDHGNLTPWRFVLAQGEGRQKLADILQHAAQQRGGDEAAIEKASKAPFRAPLVITVIAKVTPHEKVPPIEQHLSAGCAVQAMQLACIAQGFQGFWRSGPLMFDANVRQALNVHGDDEIVGFLYVGTPATEPMKAAVRDLSQFVEFI
ncbi:NAD(P)H nitroreductase [Vibrio hippocampi]|uniref:Putative NAD(P)H nitroreductase n=1 Tax=Vibrio hippocampi TaxID=654686 RepID=A0ABN8DGA2_9VIBR|nr:NAD(P)H nitroreductase [Vibrio hippocampi]CAH0525462.1 Putative NAD(P)H nitroreductase YdjA [Vibrio hippocampi]